tara:strand:- start:11538 stop:12134 length:597 start_codon:yes stop_codon:yes gene_type:complete
MKINKKILEALIEEEIHTLIKEGFASSLVRGLTKGGKRSNFLTDFLSSTLVPQVAKNAHTAANDLVKALEGMKNNQQFLAIARDKDSEGQPALPNVRSARDGKRISIHGMHKAAKAMVKDIEIMAAQLGADAPKLSGDDAPDASEPEGAPQDAPQTPAEDAPADDRFGGIVEGQTIDESINMLKKRIKAKFKKLKSIS